MFVILTYDASKRRNVKLLKICRKYLTHSQKSVFEGQISEAKLNQLQKEIRNTIFFQEDSCQIYILESIKYCKKLCIGQSTSLEEILIQSS